MPRVQLSDKELIVETALAVHQERYPDWTPDTLLIHPDEAILLCEEVRVRLHRPILQNWEILGTYLNARKQGLLRDRPASRTRHRPRASKRRPRRKN